MRPKPANPALTGGFGPADRERCETQHEPRDPEPRAGGGVSRGPTQEPRQFLAGEHEVDNAECYQRDSRARRHERNESGRAPHVGQLNAISARARVCELGPRGRSSRRRRVTTQAISSAQLVGLYAVIRALTTGELRYG